MAKDVVEQKGVVLNRMYAGSYLTTNLGHEVINLFQADNGKHYLYLNARGNFDKVGAEVKYMLLVMYVGDNCVEVVGLAKELIPIESAQCSLSRDLTKEEMKISETQREYILNEDIKYDGVPLLDLFGAAGQQNIFVSYEVGAIDGKPLFFRPKSKMIIRFDKDSTSNDCLKNHNFGSTTLHQYILPGNDDCATLNRLINNSDLWEEAYTKVALDAFTPHGASLFDICQIQNNENWRR